MSPFSEDWFKRNERFVAQDKSMAIGWEDGSGEYSKFLYPEAMCERIASDNGLLLKDLRELVAAIGLGGSIRCITSRGEDSYTDGKTIVVSTDVIEQSPYKRLDVIFGCTIHECCHCMYTDFSAVIVPSDYEGEVAKHIQNILEDEVIEEKMSMKHQGYANFLASTKEHYFSSTIDTLVENERVNTLDKILTVLLLAIRWPEKTSSYVESSPGREEMESLFTEIKQCLLENGLLNVGSHFSVTHKTKKCALEVTAILKKLIDSMPEEKSFMECAKECCSNGKSEIRAYAERMDKVSSKADTTKGEAEYKEAIREAIREFESDEQNIRAEKQMANESWMKATKFNEATDKDKQLYESIRKKAAKMTRILSECVVENEHREHIDTQHYMRSGAIGSKIVEARQGVQHVHDRKTIVREDSARPKHALLLMVDESGSMGDLNYACSMIAIAMHEAMRGHTGVDLFIYGHGDTVTTYIDHYHRSKWCLAKIRKQMEQDEVVSYREVMDKVHSMTSLPVVVVSITDSYYITDYSALKGLMDKWRKRGDSFNLLRLEDDNWCEHDGDAAEANNELYGEGNWVSAKASKDGAIEEAAKKLAMLVKKNFRKH